MRICFFTDTFFPLVGGAEMMLHHLACQLTHQGEEAVVLAPRVRRANNRVDSPYPVYRYGEPSSKRWGVRQTLVHLSWLQLRYRFQLLHCHAAYPQAYVGRSFKKIFQIPFVVRPHGSDIVLGGRIRRHPRLEDRLRRGVAAADSIIAQGRYLKNIILDLGVEEKKVHIINNGVDLASFEKAEPFDHPRPYILALGNLIHRKGFDILMRAYSDLDQKKFDLIIAGDGRERSALEQQASQLGVADRVFFVGFVQGQKKIDLFGSAEFLVCPSRSEPFANVILEALAANLPVVASAVDGNTELILHEQNGLLFPKEDEQALAQIMSTLMRKPQFLTKLRGFIPSFIQAFDWPIVAQRYLDLYRKICYQI